MRKIIAIILTIVLAVSTVMAFTSCSSYENLPSDKRAARLDKLSEEKMNDATSYDAEITGKTVLKLSGRKTTVTFSGKEQLSINGGNVLHHSELKTTAKAGSVSSSATMLLGYQYDKIYMKRSSGSEVNALYSEMTYEEYLDFLSSSSSDLLFNVDSSAAGEKSSSKRTDGGWSLVFEGFSDSAKREIESVLSPFSSEIPSMMRESPSSLTKIFITKPSFSSPSSPSTATLKSLSSELITRTSIQA